MPNLVLDGVNLFGADVRSLDKETLIRALFQTAAETAKLGLKPSISKAYALDALADEYPELLWPGY